MQVAHFKFAELNRGQIEAWSRLQRANSAFDSAFFRPEYSALVAQFQPNVEVAVIREGERHVGFWPYQRDARRVARPVGLSLCDFQGVIAERGQPTVERLVEQCGLTAWWFDHLVAPEQGLEHYCWARCNSPVIDVRGGFEHYRRQKRVAGSSTVEQALRKSRKLQREVGPLRLVAWCEDPRVLETVIAWKREQYHRLGSVDHLAAPWTCALLARAAATRSDEFSGMLSALYSGPHLVAAHLGLRARGVQHVWFPVYNHAFESYSPGLVFWVLMAEQAEQLGIQRIDLGKGQERYKRSLETGNIAVAEGAVDTLAPRRAMRKGWWRLRNTLRTAAWAAPLRKVVRSARAATQAVSRRSSSRPIQSCDTVTNMRSAAAQADGALSGALGGRRSGSPPQ